MLTSSFKLFLNSSSYSETSSEDCIYYVEKMGGCQSGGNEETMSSSKDGRHLLGTTGGGLLAEAVGCVLLVGVFHR